MLDTALRFEARAKERQVEREPRKKAKTGGQGFRQTEASGSGTVAATNTMARGQGNQARSITSQRVTLGGQELPTARLVVIHIMGGVDDLVLASDVARQVI